MQKRVCKYASRQSARPEPREHQRSRISEHGPAAGRVPGALPTTQPGQAPGHVSSELDSDPPRQFAFDELVHCSLHLAANGSKYIGIIACSGGARGGTGFPGSTRTSSSCRRRRSAFSGVPSTTPIAAASRRANGNCHHACSPSTQIGRPSCVQTVAMGNATSQPKAWLATSKAQPLGMFSVPRTSTCSRRDTEDTAR
jgi:hypothetical protein